MNEKCLLDEFQQKVVEKLSNEVVSIIIKQVESAINNTERLRSEPKTEKFDPKTLKPFDKVLGFYEVEGGNWECAIFSHLIRKECSAVCAGMIYNKYIPYNEETKHLVGTNDDCPEYYKWWEE